MKLSIVTVTFNAAATLPALQASLAAQTDRDFEWIVVDGASTDNTVQLLSACEVVTHWISEPDFGIYHALNKGLKLATGDYYVVVGADDVLEPRAVEHYRHAVADGAADIVSAPVWVDDALVAPRARSSWFRSGPPMVSAHSVGSLIRRSLHDRLGFYSRRFPIAADTYFLLTAVNAGCRFVHITEPVGRFGRDGVSSVDTLGALCESLRANTELRGRLPLQLALFVLRLVRNYPRIARGMRRLRR